MDRLSGDFNRGYTKAIMDLGGIFEYIENDLKHHKKRLNSKLLNQLLHCCLMNREQLREDKDGFIRWNCKLNDFEWYKTSK